MAFKQAIDQTRKKYAGWEQKLFNFVKNLESEHSEFTVQFTDAIELNIRYIHSSQEAASVEVSMKSERFPNAAMILIKIKDDYYAAYPNEKSMPNQVFQYLLDILEHREKQVKTMPVHKITDSFVDRR